MPPVSTQSNPPKRILLMGDFSNYHATLARELRRRGHNVTVVSNGSFWMDTTRDIDITRRLPGKIGGLDLWLRLKHLTASELTGYDIVSIAGVGFVNLRPHRIAAIFDRLRAANGTILLNMSTADALYTRACIAPDSPLRYNEWMVDGKPTAHAASGKLNEWLRLELQQLAEKIYGEVDGIFTGLYEYWLTCGRYVEPERLGYVGIPIETSEIPETGLNTSSDKVQIFLGRHRARAVEKGTDRLESAARVVASRHPNLCELQIVENLPYREYLDRLASADIVLDQLYSYTPATNALLAMAMGKVAVSGGEPEYYDFINEHKIRPIVNAVPYDDDLLVSAIDCAVTDEACRMQMSSAARQFVLRHNDVRVVADRFLEFAQKFS